MLEKEFQKKIKFLLFIQAGLNQSDLSIEQVVDAMMQADFISITEMPDGNKLGEMAIEFIRWQVHQSMSSEWDYKSNQPSWYKDEWVDLDW